MLALSLLIVLHEFGHYITARWFKCRVDKFYLFFDPWFSIVKKKIGDTVYGIGWLPLGGYCKIAGMVDESMDKDAMKQPPQPHEYRSKPAWQRLIILLGGIIMNILLAFIIYSFILMIWGEKKIPTASMKYGVHVVDSTLYKIGIRNGDKILTVDAEPIDDYERLRRKILLGNSMTLLRDGKEMTLDLPVDLIGQLVENRNKDISGFVEPRMPAMVYSVADTARVYKAGLRRNDQIIGIDSVRFGFYDELQNLLNLNKNKSVQLTVLREGQEVSFNAQVDSLGILGFRIFLNWSI